jgi:hypothetical protein
LSRAIAQHLPLLFLERSRQKSKGISWAVARQRTQKREWRRPLRPYKKGI